MSYILTLNSDNFCGEVLEFIKPVLVQFSACWNSACYYQRYTLEQFAEINIGKVKVCDLDIDNFPQLSSQYNISIVPTLIFFNNKKRLHSRLGRTDLGILNQLLKIIILYNEYSI
jgi:thioredoxin-like negative regulator of GroEL